MIVRNEQQMKSIREAAQVAATVLDRMCELVSPGMNTYDLDQSGRRFIDELGGESLLQVSNWIAYLSCLYMSFSE